MHSKRIIRLKAAKRHAAHTLVGLEAARSRERDRAGWFFMLMVCPVVHAPREGGAGCSPTCSGSACTLNAVGLLPVSGCGDARPRVAPPLAPPLCVCGEIYLYTLPYLTSCVVSLARSLARLLCTLVCRSPTAPRPSSSPLAPSRLGRPLSSVELEIERERASTFRPCSMQVTLVLGHSTFLFCVFFGSDLTFTSKWHKAPCTKRSHGRDLFLFTHLTVELSVFIYLF